MNYGPYSALINWFARNSVAANLLMVILLVGGFYTVLTIKKEIQPRIDTNYITVSVPFLGATPLDVEEGVVINWLRTIKEIDRSTFKVEIMELDETGRPQPTGKFETLEADSLILALGQDTERPAWA